MKASKKFMAVFGGLLLTITLVMTDVALYSRRGKSTLLEGGKKLANVIFVRSKKTSEIYRIGKTVDRIDKKLIKIDKKIDDHIKYHQESTDNKSKFTNINKDEQQPDSLIPKVRIKKIRIASARPLFGNSNNDAGSISTDIIGSPDLMDPFFPDMTPMNFNEIDHYLKESQKHNSSFQPTQPHYERNSDDISEKHRPILIPSHPFFAHSMSYRHRPSLRNPTTTINKKPFPAIPAQDNIKRTTQFSKRESIKNEARSNNTEEMSDFSDFSDQLPKPFKATQHKSIILKPKKEFTSPKPKKSEASSTIQEDKDDKKKGSKEDPLVRIHKFDNADDFKKFSFAKEKGYDIEDCDFNGNVKSLSMNVSDVKKDIKINNRNPVQYLEGLLTNNPVKDKVDTLGLAAFFAPARPQITPDAPILQAQDTADKQPEATHQPSPPIIKPAMPILDLGKKEEIPQIKYGDEAKVLKAQSELASEKKLFAESKKQSSEKIQKLTKQREDLNDENEVLFNLSSDLMKHIKETNEKLKEMKDKNSEMARKLNKLEETDKKSLQQPINKEFPPIKKESIETPKKVISSQKIVTQLDQPLKDFLKVIEKQERAGGSNKSNGAPPLINTSKPVAE